MSRLHNARKRLKALLGPMLALLVWVGALVLGHVVDAAAQPMIRFGVRVLQASNAPSHDNPAAPHPPPSPQSQPTAPPAPPPPPLARRQLAPPPGPPPPPAEPAPQGGEDERLKRIIPQLQMLFRYNDYTTLERHRVEGPLGTPQRFSIPGERWLEVTPDAMQGHRVRMRVRLFRGDHPEMNANIIAAPGAPAVLGGPPHGNGVLIIILWANPYPRQP